MNILEGLNQRQQEAVLAEPGPLLILAGAGSGKTKTLVHRIAYLISEREVKPWNIVAVTFTNKAAREMRDRVYLLLTGQQPPDTGKRIPLESKILPVVGTFHSVCVHILRRDIELLGYKRSFVIYDTQDQLSVIRDIMKHFNIDKKEIKPQALLGMISNAKNELKTPHDVASEVSSFMEELVAKIYPIYQERLKEANALDFDDLIMQTVRLWQQHPDVLERYQDMWQHVMIDEYQDTNTAQYTWAQLLAGKYRNISVIGDDAQSIYGWRGANIQNILSFERDYPETIEIILEQNYRSSKNIVEASNHVVELNKFKKEKKLWTENAHGDKIEIREVFDEKIEANTVVKEILKDTGKYKDPAERAKFPEDDELTYVSEDEPEEPTGILDRVLAVRGGLLGSNMARPTREPTIDISLREAAASTDVPWSDYVMLYRTNAQSRALEEVMLQYGIPYRIIGGIKFYERKEVKDIIAYLRLIANEADATSFKRIVNVPARAIGATSVGKIEAYAQAQRIIMEEACKVGATVLGRSANAASGFAQMMQLLREGVKDLTPAECIDHVLDKTGYKQFLLDGTEEGENRYANVMELKSVCAPFADKKGMEGLQEFLSDVALVSDTDTISDRSQAVTLMTVHSAKGLEFPVVFMCGMEEGIFPHARSIFEPKEMEEERRLAYVGITRAKRKLFLMHTAQRTLYGNTQVNPPSRFIDDIPNEFVERYEL